MTTISYHISSQLTGEPKSAETWESAKNLQKTTMEEECATIGWFAITAVVTNNDGSVTMCSVDENGTPLDFTGPYVDNTVSST